MYYIQKTERNGEITHLGHGELGGVIGRRFFWPHGVNWVGVGESMVFKTKMSSESVSLSMAKLD
jgi:hypothetical protein